MQQLDGCELPVKQASRHHLLHHFVYLAALEKLYLIEIGVAELVAQGVGKTGIVHEYLAYGLKVSNGVKPKPVPEDSPVEYGDKQFSVQPLNECCCLWLFYQGMQQVNPVSCAYEICWHDFFQLFFVGLPVLIFDKGGAEVKHRIGDGSF